MTPLEILKARREGGDVQRCHIIPHATSYTNGHHSYNVAQIIRTFYPGASLELIGAALDHDVAERWVGDSPATAKWMHPALGVALLEMEERIDDHFGLASVMTQNEARWLKAADLLEIWMWAQDQRYMGNKNAENVIENVAVYLLEKGGPEEFFPSVLYKLYSCWTPTRLPDKLRLSEKYT